MKRLEIEDQRQDVAQDAVRAIRIAAVLIALVVAILVAAAEAFAEIEVIVRLVHVITVVAKVRILIGEAVLVVGAPAVLAVGGAGVEAFLVAVVHRLPQQVRSVLIGLVVCAAAAPVAIDGRGIEVRIVVVIVMFVAETYLLLTLALVIFPLKAVLRHALLLLQGDGPLLGNAFLLGETLAVLRDLLLLLANELLLPRL